MVKELPELVFFGRLEERKGLVEFLEAVRILVSESGARFRVSFVGKVVSLFTEEYRGLDSRALIESKLGGKVQFDIHAALDSKSAIDFVRSSPQAVVCLASPSDNFPNAALEMGQCSRRLVVSDTKGFHQTLGLIGRTDGIYWFKPGSAHGLAKALRAGLDDRGPAPIAPTSAEIDALNQRLLQDRLNLIDSAFANKRKVPTSASARIRIVLILSTQPPDPRAIWRSLSALARSQDRPDSISVISEGLAGEALQKLRRRFPEAKFVDPHDSSLQEVSRSDRGKSWDTDYALVMIAGTAMKAAGLRNLERAAANKCSLVVPAESASASPSRVRVFEAPSVSMLVRANHSCGSCLTIALNYLESLPPLPAKQPALAIWLIILAATVQGRNMNYLPLPQHSFRPEAGSTPPGQSSDKELTQLRDYLSRLKVSDWSVRELRNLFLSVQQLALHGSDAKGHRPSRVSGEQSNRLARLGSLARRIMRNVCSV